MKLLKLTAAEMQLADLRAMPAEEIYKLCISAVSIATTAKDAQNAQKSSAPGVGKVLVRLGEMLEEQKRLRLVPSSKSLKDVFGEITKGGKIKPHWYQCKDAYSTYVRDESITEKDYDSCSANALEIAGSIYKAICDGGGSATYKTHPAFTGAAELLTSRVDGYATQLKALLATVKPAEKMTPEELQEFLSKAATDGLLVGIIAFVGAEIAHVKNDPAGAEAFRAMDTAMGMFDANTNLNGDILEAWASELQAERNAAEAAKKAAADKAAADAAKAQPQAA